MSRDTFYSIRIIALTVFLTGMMIYLVCSITEIDTFGLSSGEWRIGVMGGNRGEKVGEKEVLGGEDRYEVTVGEEKVKGNAHKETKVEKEASKGEKEQIQLEKDDETIFINKRDNGYFTESKSSRGAMLLVVSSFNEVKLVVSTIKNYQLRYNDQFKHDWIVIGLGTILSPLRDDITAIAGTVKFIELKAAALPSSGKVSSVRDLGQDVTRYPTPFRSRNSHRGKKTTSFILSKFLEFEDLWQVYDYYWRVPVGSYLGCDVTYDVFEYMRENDVQYGWSLVHTDYQGLQPEMMSQIEQFFDDKEVQPNSPFLIEDTESDSDWTYKGCAIDPEFELVDVRAFGTPEVRDFLNFVDKEALVHYKGWREPLLKTAIASLILQPKNVKVFDDLPVHDPNYGLMNCPVNEEMYLANKCSCDPYLHEKPFVTPRLKKPYGIMHNHKCMSLWHNVTGGDWPVSYQGSSMRQWFSFDV